MSGLGSRTMRSAFATSLLAVVASIASPLAAQEIKLRLAHVAPPQSTYQEAAVRFADELKKLSGGAMTVDIVPGGTLGDLGQLWVQNRQGSLDFHLIDVSAIVAMREARAFSALWAPFAFRDQAHLYAFFATDLHAILQNKGISQLVVTGVTTEVCVNTTVREANDRGYDCLVPEDCVGSYFPEFQQMGLKMIKAQGGIFGWVSNSSKVLAALG